MKKQSIKWTAGAAALTLTAGLIGGCSGGADSGGSKTGAETGNGAKQEQGITLDLQTPVKLVFYDETKMSEEVFQARFVEPVKKAFPNVSFEVVHPGKGTYVSELAASGIAIDLFMTTAWSFPLEINRQMIANLEEWVVKDKLDLNAYQPGIVDTIKSYSPQGGLYALPYSNYASALYYNKDIFDKFAQPYPTDGMTYEQAIALGKKLTRTDAGVAYTGFYPGNYSFTYALFNRGFIDLVNRKVDINTPEMKQTFELLKSGFEEQNLEYADYTAALNKFYKEKTLAMLPYHFDAGRLEAETKAGNIFNWDLAQAPVYQGFNRNAVPNLLAVSTQTKHAALVYKIMAHFPTFPELPGIGSSPSVTLYVISSQSKHKEEAFAALTALLSVETQLEKARGGSDSPLNDPVIQREFGADIPGMEGRNPQHMRMSKLASPVTLSSNTAIAVKSLQTAFDKVVSGQADVNTALREAENEANKAIAENESRRK